jgi:hypothetical protein
MDDSSTPTVWQALDTWGKQLSPWQQYILTQATSKARLSDEQITEAFSLFLGCCGLGDTVESKSASQTHFSRSSKDESKALCLLKVDGLAGINALPDGSAITFDPKLTVIYGRNGAGKSGFARLFANAPASRRSDRPVCDDLRRSALTICAYPAKCPVRYVASKTRSRCSNTLASVLHLQNCYLRGCAQRWMIFVIDERSSELSLRGKARDKLSAVQFPKHRQCI